jgi:hypothetical protein
LPSSETQRTAAFTTVVINKLVPTTNATWRLKDPSSPPAAKAEKTSEELFPKAKRVTPATVY